MNVFDRIELNPRICNGKPVIKGTRIPISVILELILLLFLTKIFYKAGVL